MLLRMHLDHVDSLNASIDKLDGEVDRLTSGSSKRSRAEVCLWSGSGTKSRSTPPDEALAAETCPGPHDLGTGAGRRVAPAGPVS